MQLINPSIYTVFSVYIEKQKKLCIIIAGDVYEKA